MITLCCTQKVRRRLALTSAASVPQESTTRLGDWYVNLIASVGKVLTALDIPPAIVRREVAEMQPAVVAPATHRRVLGSMNEFAFHLGLHMERSGDPLIPALGLRDIPMSAVGTKSHYGIPRSVARELLLGDAE